MISWFTEGVAFAWFANAIAAIWIVNSPSRQIPGLALATLVGCLACYLVTTTPFAPLEFASYAAASAAEMTAAILVLSRLSHVAGRSHPEIVWVLSVLVATTLIGPLCGAAVSTLVFPATGLWQPDAVFLRWWLGSSAGAVIVGPVLAVWSKPALYAGTDGRRAIGSVLIVALLVAATVGSVALFPDPYILITLGLMLAGARLSPRWMANACSLSAAVLVGSVAYGMVPMAKLAPVGTLLSIAIATILPLLSCVVVDRMRKDRRALMLSNDQVRRTFDESAVGMAVSTPDGILVRANKAYCDMIRTPLSHVLGKRARDLTHPDDRALHDEVVAAVLADGRPAYEFEKRYLRSDGSTFWVRVHGTVLRDEMTGEPVHILGQFFDIDQRKRAEEELAKVRERLDIAMESGGQGVWEIDYVTGMSYRTPTWDPILGLAFEHQEASVEEWVRRTHPDDLPAIYAAHDDHESGRAARFEATYRMRHKDGRWIWLLSRGRAVERDADGKILRMIGTAIDITSQKENEEKLASLHARFRLAAQAGGVGMWSWNETTKELIWDERMYALYGLDHTAYRTQQVVWIDHLHPDDCQIALTAINRTIADGTPYNTVFRVVWPTGEIRHIRALGHRRIDADGSVTVIGTNWDVTEQRLVADALAAEKERLRVTLHSIGDAVICTDTRGRITFMNLAAETLTGFVEPLVVGEPLDSIYQPVHEENGEILPSSVAEALRVGVAVEQHHPGKLVRKDGSARSIRDTAAPVRAASGELIGAVLVFQDVTTARALQRDLAYAASHDALTGLKNRAAFEGALQSAHVETRINGHQHAVLFVDLDRFKVLNDTAGHAAGDSLLREIAAVINGCVRRQDLVARLGGDEFGILLTHRGIDDAERVGTKIVERVKAVRFAWNGKIYSVGASVGITALTAQSIAVADVVAQADVACYAAKAGGRDRVSVYRPDSSEAHRHLSDLHIAAGIRESIEADRFRLYAQEIRDLSSPLARGRKLEILTRMIGPDGEMVPPGVFIPAAERFDLMGALDQWVLRTTLRTYGAAIQSVPGLTIAVNLSANSLNDPSLWDFLSGELAATGFDPNRLELEITETAVINNFAAAERFVEAARRAGCHVSLDDFGSGVSSFSYLKRFPVDTIKIDGIFVRNMKSSQYDRTIVRLIHEIGAELGVDTVAEYVEDVETVEMLSAIGVRYGQGYLFHRPRPILEVLAEHGAREPDLRRVVNG